MARKRMISPEFFTSAPVNALPIPAMVTFAGLWVYLDDQGRGEDDPALVRAVVWPRRAEISEAIVAEHLGLLHVQGLLCRYEVGGFSLIHSPSWAEHQKISHPAEEKHPPCSRHEDLAYKVFRSDRGGPLEKFRRGSGGAREGLRSRSGKTPPSVVEVSSVKSSSGAVPDSQVKVEGSKARRDDLAARRNGAASA